MEPVMFGLFGKKIEEILGDGDYETSIAGVTHYQKNLKAVFKKLSNEEFGWFYTKATLRPDNKNKYDANAVAVEIDGKLVGYLPAVGKFTRDDVNALEFRDDYSDKSKANKFQVDCKLKEQYDGTIIGLLDIREDW